VTNFQPDSSEQVIFPQLKQQQARANQSIDYKIFNAQYNTLRNEFPERFEQKVFAENVVYKGKKMRLQDSSNFQMLHDNLNTFASSEERSQLMLSTLSPNTVLL
jgi:hypothetical protein